MCPTVLLAAACVMPIEVHPVAWQREETRGNVTHTVQAEAARLTLVCNPGNSYGYPQQYLQFEFEQDMLERQVVLESASQKVELSLIADSLLKRIAPPKTWAAMLELISSGEAFTISTEDQSWNMIPDSQPDHGCTS